MRTLRRGAPYMGWGGFPLMRPSRSAVKEVDQMIDDSFASWWSHYLCILSLGSLEAPEECFYIQLPKPTKK